jgi:hypothetical protein
VQQSGGTKPRSDAKRNISQFIGKLKPQIGSEEVAAPNEAIRLDINTIFVAIPKTGTTSIRTQFRPRGPFLLSAPHLTIRQLKELWHLWHIRESLGKNTKVPTDPSIVLSDFEVLSASQRKFADALKFATVRNPFARTLSLYRRREGIQVEQVMSFHEFCERLAYASDTCKWPTRNENQIDWLTDWDNQTQIVENVLRLEELAHDIAHLANSFPQISFLRAQFKNRNTNSAGSIYHKYYSRSARAAIEVLFKRDLDAFNYDF